MTYSELQKKLVSIGFKDISANYSSAAATLLYVGYGQNKDPWPRIQIRVFRTQESRGSQVIFVDWMDATGECRRPIEHLEDAWIAGMRLATEACKGEGACG